MAEEAGSLFTAVDLGQLEPALLPPLWPALLPRLDPAARVHGLFLCALPWS